MNLLRFPPTRHAIEDDISPAIVLVEPETALLECRSVLLTHTGFVVSLARSSGDVWELRSKLKFDVAVLSDSLGRVELCNSAKLVRRHWPQARILILGCASSSLDDPLYDEAVDAKFQPKIFIETLMRMCRGQRDRDSSISPTNGCEPSTQTENDLYQPSPRRENTSTEPVSDVVPRRPASPK